MNSGRDKIDWPKSQFRALLPLFPIARRSGRERTMKSSAIGRAICLGKTTQPRSDLPRERLPRPLSGQRSTPPFSHIFLARSYFTRTRTHTDPHKTPFATNATLAPRFSQPPESNISKSASRFSFGWGFCVFFRASLSRSTRAARGTFRYSERRGTGRRFFPASAGHFIQ